MPLASTASLQWFGPAALACRGGGTAAAAGTIRGVQRLSGGGSGAGALSAAHITGLRTAALTPTGVGAAVLGPLRGRGRVVLPVSIGSRPSADDVAQAVWGSRFGPLNDPESFGVLVKLVSAVLRNRTVTDPVAGTLTVYDDDDTTPLLAADLWQDAAGTVPYSGSGAERRDRLT